MTTENCTICFTKLQSRAWMVLKEVPATPVLEKVKEHTHLVPHPQTPIGFNSGMQMYMLFTEELDVVAIPAEVLEL